MATCAAVAVKLAVVAPDATVTLEGTVRFALLLESVTLTPPLPAAADKVAVQDVVPGVAIVLAVHVTLLRVMGVGSVMTPDPPAEGSCVPDAVEATTPVTETGILVVDGFAAI